jgi:membrane-associated phospholipid phosphatase
MRPFPPLAAALLAATVAVVPAARAADPPPMADWPTLLIASPAAIVVPPPPGAAETAAELAALRAASADRGPDLARRLRRWETGGPVYLWNAATVAALVDRHLGNPPGSRALALLHATLYDVSVVVAAAKAAHPRRPPAAQDGALAVPGVRSPDASYPSEAAAMGAAATALLGDLLPAEAARFGALAAEGERLRREAGLEFPSDAAAGRTIGEAVAALALARARDDGFGRPWTGTIPIGPGRWVGTQPTVPGNATWRPWVLPSNDALRPPPPPAFDSPQVEAELAELRAYPRTPKATADAIFWNVHGGNRNFQFWNAELSRKALEYGLAENAPRMAAAFAALAIAYHDGHIACWDAKYTYWYIRPSQLDTRLTTVFPVASHPAYPSAHACLSTSAATVLAALFPDEATHYQEMNRQAGESRVAAGVHYRFDVEAGQEIGRRAAALALARMAPALR